MTNNIEQLRRRILAHPMHNEIYAAAILMTMRYELFAENQKEVKLAQSQESFVNPLTSSPTVNRKKLRRDTQIGALTKKRKKSHNLKLRPHPLAPRK